MTDAKHPTNVIRIIRPIRLLSAEKTSSND